MKNSKFRGLILYVIIFVVLIWAFSAFGNAAGANRITFAQLVDYFQQEEVTAFEVNKQNRISIQLKDGSVKFHELSDLMLFEENLGDLVRTQKNAGIITDYDFKAPYIMPAWLQVTLPAIISVVLVMVFWWIMALRQQQAQGGADMGADAGASDGNIYDNDFEDKT